MSVKIEACFQKNADDYHHVKWSCYRTINWSQTVKQEIFQPAK